MKPALHLAHRVTSSSNQSMNTTNIYTVISLLVIHMWSAIGLPRTPEMKIIYTFQYSIYLSAEHEWL